MVQFMGMVSTVDVAVWLAGWLVADCSVGFSRHFDSSESMVR